MSEPLVFLPMERWGELKSVFKSDWPRGISAYTTLDTAEHIVNNGADYGFKAYVPFGDLTNGLVALNVKGTFYEVVVQCPKDDTTVLEDALMRTKLIDWNRSFHIPFTPKNVSDLMKRIITKKNLSSFTTITVTDTFYYNETPNFNVSLPSGFKFELLRMEDAQIADDTWPHKHPGSVWYFKLLIKAKLGYGLYKNNELIAWCYVKEMGALGHLYVVENHRRKGYGELVLKLISNTLAKEGKFVLAFCVVGNEGAKRLYQKLEFIQDEPVEWITVVRK
ncbi:unnamed protein product [Leptidea sinapis]|uniref:N-acetyltransferase domain-containing protein n=1 Tax=Leptidea sinapis TaxID=189913 RepID=A0A5E4QS98_9NEOP|nr:unnamed protein product [Leptidea sinapis]